MKKIGMREALWVLVLLTTDSPSLVRAQPDPDNRPPEVSVVWPRQGDSFSLGTLIKIKTESLDLNGSVAEVQFFAETNLIGVVTNPPFNLVWPVDVRPLTRPGFGTLKLKVLAVDNFGAKTESAAVSVGYYTDPPPAPVVEIVSPSDRAMSAPPATFVFSAELLASTGDSEPVEFFVGTNSAGVVDLGGSFSATMPPASVTVSNLLEGEYKLTVRYLGVNGTLCPCKLITNTVRVVQLGVRLPSVTPDDRLQFEVVTAFPGKPTVIQASTNLLDWAPMSTNQPTSNTFSITESSPATNSQRFFRVFLPP